MYPQISYVMYAVIVNIFTIYIITDYHFNIILDKYTENERDIENQYFDHIVGKCLFIINFDNNTH